MAAGFGLTTTSLCRYITRPALANERVQTNAAGQVVLKLTTPWRDGTTHLVMSPLEFMQRLAALVPRPRLHLIRFHGVLAPNAKLRALVVPQVVPQEPKAPAQEAEPAACEASCAHHRPVRLSWAKLLKRVFEIDMEYCPNCGGELKIIAAILEQPVIEKILTHLGLQARAPPRAPARSQALQATLRCPTATVQPTPSTRAAGVGFVQSFSGPMDAVRRRGVAVIAVVASEACPRFCRSDLDLSRGSCRTALQRAIISSSYAGAEVS